VANLVAAVAVQLLLLAHYGAGELTDAFFASSTLPQLVIAILVGAAVSVIVPMFAGRARDGGGDRDAWTLICWSAVVLFGLSAVIAALAGPITRVLVPGLSVEGKALATQLTVINAAALPLAGVTSIAAALHQGRGRFVGAELVGAATSFVLLLAVLWLLPIGGLVLVAWLFAARAALQLALLLPGLGRPYLSLRRTATVEELVRGMRPLLFSTSYFKLAPLVDRWLASFGLAGDISLLQVLQQVFGALGAVVSKSVVGPLTAFLATERMHGASLAARRSQYLRLQRLTGVLSALGFALGVAAALVLARRLLPPHQADRLVILIVALAGLYTAGFLGQLSAAWFYAEGDTGVPARVGAIGFTIGLATRGILFPVLGTVGIAIALSVNQIVNWAMMYRRILRDTVKS
jgi:putative peptidoglycan lipid II flippase